MRYPTLVASAAVVIALTLAGFIPQQPTAPFERFKLIVIPDGRVLRIDSQTGSVASVTDKGLTTLPVNDQIQLKVGQLYVLETGESTVYQGNKKFGSVTDAADALVKKYAGDKKTL
jgi:hypothetical protein